MVKIHTSRRRVAVAALAAFGAASLGLVSSARADDAHRDRDRDGLVDRYEDDRGYRYDDHDRYQVGRYGQDQGDVDVDADIYVDLDRYRSPIDLERHVHADYRHYDHDRNGYLDSQERKAYWRHLADMGLFGPRPRHVSAEIARLAKGLDRDGDGRLTRREVTLVRRFLAARRMFEVQDRDDDRRLFRNETRGWLRQQFARLDRNRDRTLTRSEIRQHFIRLDRERPRVWSWHDR